jgi:hypothetical protein
LAKFPHKKQANRHKNSPADCAGVSARLGSAQIRAPKTLVFDRHFSGRALRFTAGNRSAEKLASLNFPLTMMDRARKNAYLCAQPCSSWRVYE